MRPLIGAGRHHVTNPPFFLLKLVLDIDNEAHLLMSLRQTWACKLMICVWQYFILANYSWLLMEGLYLHSLIFMALFTDSSAITLYILLGWGGFLNLLAYARSRLILRVVWVAYLLEEIATAGVCFLKFPFHHYNAFHVCWTFFLLFALLPQILITVIIGIPSRPILQYYM